MEKSVFGLFFGCCNYTVWPLSDMSWKWEVLVLKAFFQDTHIFNVVKGSIFLTEPGLTKPNQEGLVPKTKREM